MMKIFESHAHLDNPKFNHDRDHIIGKCRNEGIEKIINIGCDKKTSLDSIALAEQYDFIFASAGFHPHDAKDFDAEFIRKALTHPKVVAIGEIGLDYFRNLSPRDIQLQVFRDQLKLSAETGKPVVIHNRDADEDTYNILCEFMPQKAVYHCFSGDQSYAEKVLEKGWFISFTGNITYKNSEIPDIVRMVPNDRFFIETDCPYLTPHPHRGKRNDPTYLRYIIEKISEIKGMTPKMVAEQTYKNAENFFFKK